MIICLPVFGYHTLICITLLLFFLQFVLSAKANYMPLISLQSVCNYHLSSVKRVVNDNVRKYLFSPFEGRKNYLVVTLTFVFRVPKYNDGKILSSFFIQKEENIFCHRLMSNINDTLATCHTFIYHHWL